MRGIPVSITIEGSNSINVVVYPPLSMNCAKYNGGQALRGISGQPSMVAAITWKAIELQLSECRATRPPSVNRLRPAVLRLLLLIL